MTNILLVGGAGYIGSHTVKEFQKQNHSCFVLDNLVYGHRDSVPDSVFIKGDILEKGVLCQIFEKYSIDAVIHFAGYTYVGESVENPSKYYWNNFVGTLNLLDSMRLYGVNKIVFSSTCAIYGNPEYLPIDENHPQKPINPYGKGKLMVERLLEDYHNAYGLDYISLRYFNVAGCDSEGFLGERHEPETHLIPLVLQTILGERAELSIFGTDYETSDGTCIRDYIHIEDLALAHRLAAEKLLKDGGVACLNLGTGIGTSVKEIVEVAEKITGQKVPISYMDRRVGDPAVLVASNLHAREFLKWELQHSSIDEIVQTAWDWFRTNHSNNGVYNE